MTEDTRISLLSDSPRSTDLTVAGYERRIRRLTEALAPFAREARYRGLTEDKDRYSFADTGLSNRDFRLALIEYEEAKELARPELQLTEEMQDHYQRLHDEAADRGPDQE